ncbi:MAG: hypothetical protein D6737_14160 [Chloroflexi bacterium]|nr:MAG: hypothetical protein CUN54_07785 [Phototrophicales bacterium]RMF78624.1 MAG: hypothetical protein D6737_14160 [Chloroflexota bacterium]
MDSFQETRRQLQIAILAIAVIVPAGVVGFLFFEKNLGVLDAIWITITTLTTIGYGDQVAVTTGGRIFTLVLIVVGLGTFLFAIQATATFFVSPAVRDLRQKRRIQREIDGLTGHFIICGNGELVNQTINYTLERERIRQASHREQLYKPIDEALDSVFGDDAEGYYTRIRSIIRRVYLRIVAVVSSSTTLLDVLVVVTNDGEYANHIRDKGLLVVEGDPTDDDVLIRAGIKRAAAMMVMLNSDTEALLTVLTGRSHNSDLYITAATLEEELSNKILRIGADSAIAPFDVTGKFFNNATLRPAVNEFFNSILFHDASGMEATQLYLPENSPWVGKRLKQLELSKRFDAAVIGLRKPNGEYIYTPGEDFILQADITLIVIAPVLRVEALAKDSLHGTGKKSVVTHWKHLHTQAESPYDNPKRKLSMVEAEEEIAGLSNHFIICGSGRVARNAVRQLDPERPFVVISDDNVYTADLLRRGFRVVHGNPTREDVLRKAGVEQALAIMISIEDRADSVLTVLTCRALSNRILITTTALSDDMIPKLKRAGADRVDSAFHIAAQMVMLATTRPAVNDFLEYVIYNYSARIETTELYMQDNSPWIGKTIDELLLDRLFRAGVIGIRQPDGQYIYAPSGQHVLKENEVMIVVTPMMHSDELRLTAHGTDTSRPYTLRHTGELSKVLGKN